MMGNNELCLQMLAKSEARIDRTNEMVDKLVKTIDELRIASKDTREMYDKHLTSLESARDKLIDVNAELISANKTLVKELELLRGEFIESRKEYHKVLDAYLMIASGSKGAKAEVKINK